MSRTDKALRAIIHDIEGRSGGDALIASLDDETRTEIEESWGKILDDLWDGAYELGLSEGEEQGRDRAIDDLRFP